MAGTNRMAESPSLFKRLENKMFEAICYIVGASVICFGIPSAIMLGLTTLMCNRIEKHGAILKRNWN
jgi:hypothetical protein